MLIVAMMAIEGDLAFRGTLIVMARFSKVMALAEDWAGSKVHGFALRIVTPRATILDLAVGLIRANMFLSVRRSARWKLGKEGI